MKKLDNFIFFLKNISYFGMLTYLITFGISLNVVAAHVHDRIDDQIEVTQDAEGEKESSESEFSDNFEMDDYDQHSGKRACWTPLNPIRISPKTSGIDFGNYLAITTPPPEILRG